MIHCSSCSLQPSAWWSYLTWNNHLCSPNFALKMSPNYWGAGSLTTSLICAGMRWRTDKLSLDLFTQPCVCVFLVSFALQTDSVFSSAIEYSYVLQTDLSFLCAPLLDHHLEERASEALQEKNNKRWTWKSKGCSWGCPRARFRGWRKWNQHSGNEKSPAGRNQQAIKTGNE